MIDIGEWQFDPDGAELRRGQERRALEDRAARVLAMLARERGKIVTHDELVAEIWGGRAISANSVAVVIGDLRRALGETARAPTHIETIAKRGYRLREAAIAPAPARRNALPFAALVAAGLAAIGGAGLLLPRPAATAPLAVAMADISNETGDARYDALAQASEEVAIASLAAARDIHLTRGDSGNADVIMSGRLILWSGHPSVSLSAEDQSARVIWSAIAAGPEDELPRQIDDGIAAFAAAAPDGFPAEAAR